MSEKRYAIVRVDNRCPAYIEAELNANECKRMFKCKEKYYEKDCSKVCKNYGDTKEQLIRKIAQILKIATNKKQTWIGLAKEIVEFLGVE